MMSKSLLVIDTPNTCGDCPLCIHTAEEKRYIGYCNTSDEDYYCRVLKRFMEYDKVDGGLDILGKPIDCPLQEESEEKRGMRMTLKEWEQDHIEVLTSREMGEWLGRRENGLLDKIRADIEVLDIFYDNDYFSGNKDPMYKCNEVLEIIDKYREEQEE